jgi:hypothetical protein
MHDLSWQSLPCSECAGETRCTSKDSRCGQSCQYIYGKDICRWVIIKRRGIITSGYILEGFKKHSHFPTGQVCRIKCITCGRRMKPHTNGAGQLICKRCQDIEDAKPFEMPNWNVKNPFVSLQERRSGGGY